MTMLNLGCGYRKIPGYINIDIRPEVNPDLVCDCSEGLPFKDGSVQKVRAFDFLEHIPTGKTVRMIEEIWRVFEPGVEFESLTPSTDGRGAFQDPFHVSFWCANSWLYYMDDAYRDLYGIKAKFEGKVQDYVTSKELRIIHTYCQLRKVPLP
jgi:SAM-dependent methyltransferase